MKPRCAILSVTILLFIPLVTTNEQSPEEFTLMEIDQSSTSASFYANDIAEEVNTELTTTETTTTALPVAPIILLGTGSLLAVVVILGVRFRLNGS